MRSLACSFCALNLTNQLYFTCAKCEKDICAVHTWEHAQSCTGKKDVVQEAVFTCGTCDARVVVNGVRCAACSVATLSSLQNAVRDWALHNFGPGQWWHRMLLLMEELGELAHALLKKEQGIRLEEDHVAKAKDAVGDLAISLADFCNSMGWNFEELVAATWAEVKKRDWTVEKMEKRVCFGSENRVDDYLKQPFGPQRLESKQIFGAGEKGDKK